MPLAQDAITFHTDGEWSARQLAAAFDALERLYLVCLLASGQTPVPRVRPAFRTDDMRSDVQARIAEPPVPPAVAEPYLRNLLQDGVAWSQTLVLHDIKMASPGWFTFLGVAATIYQLRHLVKDVAFRNRNEDRSQQLRGNVQEEFVRVLKAHNARHPDHALYTMAKLAADGLVELRTLADSGRLALPPGKPQAPKKPKPGRQKEESRTVKKKRPNRAT